MTYTNKAQNHGDKIESTLTVASGNSSLEFPGRHHFEAFTSSGTVNAVSVDSVPSIFERMLQILSLALSSNKSASNNVSKI